MSIHVEYMTSESTIEYENFLLTDEKSMIYSSFAYFAFLQNLLPDAEGVRLIARDEQGRLRGGLPFFIRDGKSGPIANSLPFFGTPTGLCVPDHAKDVQDALLGRFRALVQERRCIASTFIASPLDPDPTRHRHVLQADFLDQRIGLITPLPMMSDHVADSLMALFHSKSRNMVRKSQQSGFRLDTTLCDENWGFLQRTHQANMAKLQAAIHPPEFFHCLRDDASPVIHKRLYTAYLGDTPVAGLLLLYFNRTVDYCIPVIDGAYRSSQPLSFLIMHAMQDAVASGYRWWNWGGTGVTQESLYRFKKRLGAIDHPYCYVVTVFDDRLLRMDRQELMREYPFFFAYPFSQVK